MLGFLPMEQVSSEVLAREGADSSLRNNYPPIDTDILGDLKKHYKDVELDFIFRYLDNSKLRVIHEESWTEPRDYMVNAWIESMSESELEGYHYYDALPEFRHHYSLYKMNFLNRERNFIKLNLGSRLNREASEKEVEAAFADEVAQGGKSISAKCRALYALKYPERVVYVGKNRPLVHSTLESAVNSANYVALEAAA